MSRPVAAGRDRPGHAGEIQHAVGFLAEFPHIGTVTDRSPEFRGVRAGRYPYHVYCRIRGDEVWIVHIRDMRREPGHAI